jgi:predicted ATPase/DNA-binding winged helix-turn-helix (wHTH) protein
VPETGQQPVYASNGWEIDLAGRELRLRGVPVSIGSRAFDVMQVLVQSGGTLVSKHDLMDRVWPSQVVEENALQSHICAVRKALGPDRGLLKTVFGRGYCLLGTWTTRKRHSSGDSPERSVHSNLPARVSGLVGRRHAIQQLLGLLSAHRVVTLTGPGGIGKSVLAREVARGLLPKFPDAAYLAELAALTDPGLVPTTVARVLGQPLGNDRLSADSVGRAIGAKKLLVVLDNCEHLIEAVAELAQAIVRMCPNAWLLATSREALRIHGEHVYQVAPLDVPPRVKTSSRAVLEHSAVQLFISRAKASHSAFSPQEESLSDIAAICRNLDGIPLAIEFAAARAAALGVRQVALLLNDRFRLLTSGHRGALPRHRTLRATFDWSYELLSEEERSVLRQLGIFPTGFTIEAASAVIGDAPGAPSAVVEGLASLVAKSLVITSDGADSAGRWRLLETIRVYALDRLNEAGEAQPTARRHAAYFRDLVGTTPGPKSALTLNDITRWEREIDNVRAALDWCFSPTGNVAIGVALTATFSPVWLYFGMVVECRERAEHALDFVESGMELAPRLRMQLYFALGAASFFSMAPPGRARMALMAALEIARTLADVDTELRALWPLYAGHFQLGECRLAKEVAEQFLRVARHSGNPQVALVGERMLGHTLLNEGKSRAGQHYCQSVLDLYVAPKDHQSAMTFHYDQRVQARGMLARALWMQGFVDRAHNEAAMSLEEAQELDDRRSICWTLLYSGIPVALARGDFLAAERLISMLIEFSESLNSALWGMLVQCAQAKLLISQGDFRKGTSLVRSALEEWRQTGRKTVSPEVTGTFAQGLAGLGKLADALVTMDLALEWSDCGGELWFAAELLRLKGELLLKIAGDPFNSTAVECFERALYVAEGQRALFWRLRAAISLASLMLRQDRPGEAKKVLAPVYNLYTEGFETADLRSAKAILDSLPS